MWRLGGDTGSVLALGWVLVLGWVGWARARARARALAAGEFSDPSKHWVVACGGVTGVGGGGGWGVPRALRIIRKSGQPMLAAGGVEWVGEGVGAIVGLAVASGACVVGCGVACEVA